MVDTLLVEIIFLDKLQESEMRCMVILFQMVFLNKKRILMKIILEFNEGGVVQKFNQGGEVDSVPC